MKNESQREQSTSWVDACDVSIIHTPIGLKFHRKDGQCYYIALLYSIFLDHEQEAEDEHSSIF